MKLRNKLTYKFAIIVASILLIFSVNIYYFSASFRAQQFDKRLVDKGLTTARLLINVDEVDAKLLRIIDRNNLSALYNEKITVYDSNFRKIYSSDDDPEIPVSNSLFNEIKIRKQVFFDHYKNEVVGFLFKDKDKSYFVVVSAFDHFGINKLKNLRLILLASFIVSMGAIFIAGWLFSGQALTPISNIVNQVKKISGSNLHLRVDEGNGQDEIALLAIQFNQMLLRIEQAFDVQKSFVSNASHELRTPLSTIRAQLEVAISNRERSKEEYLLTLESVLDDINNLISLSNGLLGLAQVGVDVSGSTFKKLRVDEIVYQSISDISHKYPKRNINFNIEDSSDEETLFIIMGNEVLLRTAFVNILDNACKFSGNQPIDVSISCNTQEAVISVKDQGSGIKTAELNHIFDPFYRGSNVRNISGHGIGLSLSRKIIDMHKGRIDFYSELNKGTTVLLHLPVIH